MKIQIKVVNGGWHTQPTLIKGKEISIPEAPGISLVTNKAGFWSVYEKTTGLKVSSGAYKTEKSAIENATKRILDVGLENTKLAIQRADKLN